MQIKVLKDPEELGLKAAEFTAHVINQAIKEQGYARIILSTGNSQLDTIKELVKMNIDWSKVDMFHLDEYIGLPETHPASFRKYLKERFTSILPLRNAFFVDGETDVQQNIHYLSEEIRKESIDVALIGIGENAHIAFNDPPADFETKDAFIVVNLDDRCKMQQVGEGWFKTVNDVPKQAITMTVHQILQSKVIISCVPYLVKADAVKATIENDVTNLKPGTILKTHPNFNLFIDKDSASKVSHDYLRQ